MIQAYRRGYAKGLKGEIDGSIDFILNKVIRLPDGTFARNRPMPNSVWVDDLYQGIPALAEMGKLTGEKRYYDEAVGQVLAFAGLLFDKSKEYVCMDGLKGWIHILLFIGREPTVGLLWRFPPC
jgi:hypothetical protein